jgi:hypothetical protein
VPETVDDCLERAKRLERAADQDDDSAHRAAMVNLAQQWRERAAALILAQKPNVSTD